MASARAIFQAHVDDFPTTGAPSVVTSSAWTLPNAAIRVETLTLSLGTNTLTQPIGSTVLELIPPPTNVVTLTIKGAVSDTGWRVSSTQPTILTMNGPGPRLIVTDGAVTGCVLRWY